MFTHLHTHTEYSLLDGLSRIEPMLRRCQELGMDSLAITDHGALHGLVEFYSLALQMGIKPILGCETYVASGDRRQKIAGDKSPFHLTVLAQNNIGYRNMIQLISKAHLQGFYYKPRVDRELLREHREGLILLSGCLNGELPRLIKEDRLEEARDTARWYQETYGENFFLEIQRHPALPQLEAVNKVLVDLGKELGIGLVATNDSHYINQEDAALQDLLICIHTNTTINDEKRLKIEGNSNYLKSPQEMSALFEDMPEAISNTRRIAENCEIQMDFGRVHLPGYPTPMNEDPDVYLGRLCKEGLTQRCTGTSMEYQERLDYELDVIRQTQFANYFLVVWDIITFARRNDILYGVRGSAAGSLALYCLGVTDVDPVEYGLVFERFLNIERKEMPDIDMDFQDDRREEVIQHVVQKYGRDHVAQIITFGTLGPKAALRDVGRALAMPYADVDRLARLVPFRAKTLEEALIQTPELQALRDSDPNLRKLIESAGKMEGLTRHVSTHAAGVVITQEPLTEYVPLQRPVHGDENSMAMTQFSMAPIAQLGLLKMDFLGLINLTILKEAVRLVDENRGLCLELKSLPLDDLETFELLASGETADVFQLEGSGVRRHIRELRPSSLREISAMIALYRPGPMEHIETYINAKHGKIEVEYPHPSLKELLEETYGVIVYQDQVLQIIQRFAGYTLGEADIFRKSMGKKIPEIMRRERERFIQGAVSGGVSNQEAEAIFLLIEPFAGYAFNKAHAVSYALIAYWTAYFKANYTVEYLTAVLNSRLGNMEKVAATVAEAQRLNIPVLPPDIIHSQTRFAMEKQSDNCMGIRFGLSAVKNVGEGAVRPLVEARDNGSGPFTTVEEMCRRVDIGSANKRTLESLVKVGALDVLGVERGTLLAGLDRILRMVQREGHVRQSGQTSMLDFLDEPVETSGVGLDLTPATPATPEEKLAWERELLGVTFSGNSFSTIFNSLELSDATISVQDIGFEQAGERKIVVGVVTAVRSALTRDGKPFANATLTLMDGTLELVIWPNVYIRCRELLQEGKLVRIAGKIRVREEKLSLACDELTAVNHSQEPSPRIATYESNARLPSPNSANSFVNNREGRKNGVSKPNGSNHINHQRPSSPIVAHQLRITLQETEDPIHDEERLRDVLKALLEYEGKDRVLLEVNSGDQKVAMNAPYTTSCCPELYARLERLLGADAVLMDEPSPSVLRLENEN